MARSDRLTSPLKSLAVEDKPRQNAPREVRMLFLHERLTATASRQNDVVARVQNIHSYMQKHPGFIRARVARYLGGPNEYLVMRWWRSAEDLAEHGRNPVVPNWGANRPEGIYLVP